MHTLLDIEIPHGSPAADQDNLYEMYCRGCESMRQNVLEMIPPGNYRNGMLRASSPLSREVFEAKLSVIAKEPGFYARIVSSIRSHS